MENFRISDYIEVDSLDFLTKYAIIITNFIIIIALVLYNKYFKKPEDGNPSNEKHSILILVANPDDIIQYFVPTIINHLDEYNFHILSLSYGRIEGEQEKIIEKEFEKTCSFLGIKKFLFQQDESLKYDSSNEWSASHISNKIIEYVQANNIKALISFDEYAVDKKINHLSIAKALKLLIFDEEKKNKLPENFKIYELITVNLIRKNLGLWDFLFCVLHYYVYLNTNIFKNFKLMNFQKSRLNFLRKMEMFFSRYSYVNTLKRIK